MNAIERRIKSVQDRIDELKDAFDAIQQPRPDYVLEKFVVWQHDTEPQAYMQCVLEMQIKYDAIRRAKLTRQRLLLQIVDLETDGSPIDYIDAKLKQIDIEAQDRAMLGALREFEALYRIWKGFGRCYTRTELNAAQEEYWVKRLTRQANQDIKATGRVGVGNLEALQQAGLVAMPQLESDVGRQQIARSDE